jgi:hypothetical protein
VRIPLAAQRRSKRTHVRKDIRSRGHDGHSFHSARRCRRPCSDW